MLSSLSSTIRTVFGIRVPALLSPMRISPAHAVASPLALGHGPHGSADLLRRGKDRYISIGLAAICALYVHGFGNRPSSEMWRPSPGPIQGTARHRSAGRC